MRPPRATFAGVTHTLTIAILAVAGVPITTAAGARAQPRSLADKLRYGPGVTNHPVHVRPSEGVRIPEGWPLAGDGTLTCLTCHLRLPPLEGATQTYLRDPADFSDDPLDFCRNCHSDDGERSAGALHWMAVGEAHVGGDDAQPSSSVGSLDAESRRCMGCHDGVSAAETQNTTAGDRGGGYLGDRSRNHPVGVRYPDRPSRDRTVPFRSIALLPTEIRLVDGKVSCVSCHDLYAIDRNRLTVSLERSALCFTCHEMG